MTTVIRRVRLSFGRLAQLTAPVLLAVGLFALGTGGASAVTITFADNASPFANRSTINCLDECEGALFDSTGTALDASDGWSATNGDVVPMVGGNSVASHVSFINTALGTSYVTADGAKIFDGGNATHYESAVINAAYVLLHIGGGSSGMSWLLIKNTALDGLFSFVFDKIAGSNGGGLSSVTTIGVAAVPVPAGIALGASALGLLGFMGWRRKKTVAA